MCLSHSGTTPVARSWKIKTSFSPILLLKVQRSGSFLSVLGKCVSCGHFLANSFSFWQHLFPHHFKFITEIIFKKKIQTAFSCLRATCVCACRGGVCIGAHQCTSALGGKKQFRGAGNGVNSCYVSTNNGQIWKMDKKTWVWQHPQYLKCHGL